MFQNRTKNHLDLLLSGNLVLDDEHPVKGSLGIKNKKIVAIGDKNSLGKADKEIDFGDLLIFPGAVDAHCHSIGYEYEGFTSSTRGAAAGGVTTINDHPLDLGGAPVTAKDLEEKKMRMAQEVHVDYCLTGGVVSGQLADLPGAIEAGIVAYKALMHSTADPSWYHMTALEDWELLKSFEVISQTKLPVIVHAENENLIAHYTKELRSQGKTYPAAHNESRPDITEIEAVSRAICFAGASNVHLHLAHLSLPQSFILASEARQKGVLVTAETCPHFLVLTMDRWKDVGARYKINPPLRSEEARAGLWRLLTDGYINIVASDHAPHAPEIVDDIFENPSGSPGIETLVPLMFSEGVSKGNISLSRFTQLVSTNPAKMLKIYPQKGAIRIGSDADLMVLDPKKKWTIEGHNLQTPCKLTVFEGIPVVGRVVSTFVRGKQVYLDGEIIGQPGDGQFVARGTN